MKCPVDGSDLVMSDRQGIEIDYCPKCRGVWLDRGELDKIIERSVGQTAASAPAPVERREPPREYREESRQRSDDRRDYDDDDRHKPKKRKSFLDDIFDF
ncbi:MAG: zf-TFIIB domain-containing protein [Anaerolineae bacterium]|nr:zf-TFIIB domain-containing protein [Anaerolineae bacterium]